MKITVIPLLASALAGCGYDRFDDPAPDDSGYYPLPNTGIVDVRAMCSDEVCHVNTDIVIGGYVTANDKSGNIYRSFFIEDGTGAAEIRAGMYSLHNVFITGRYVTVKLDGLSVSLYNGVMQVGLPPSEGYASVDYFDNWTFASEYIHPTGIFSDPEPSPVAVTGLSENMCGRLVRLDGMTYSTEPEEGETDGGTDETVNDEIVLDEAPGWAYPRDDDNPLPRSAYRYFGDGLGNEMAVQTSGYATFAGRKVPVGKVSVTGILSYGATDKGKMYILRLRDYADVQLQVAR